MTAMIDTGGGANPEIWIRATAQMTERRAERLAAAANARTRHIRLIIQDIHHPHNVSACLRSAEAFGVNYCDVVCLHETFAPSTVTRGVHHWLTIQKHDSIAQAAATIKGAGYKIAAATVAPSALPLSDLPLDQPIAVLFANEKNGPAPEWLPHVDLWFTIPMAGLVESLNVSVSAAITLFTLTTRARRELPAERYFLTLLERHALLTNWANHEATFGTPTA